MLEALHRFVQAYAGDAEAAGFVVDDGGDSLRSSQRAPEHEYKIFEENPPAPVRGPLVFALCAERSQDRKSVV